MRKRSNSAVDYSWLDQFVTEGPFLSLPVVKSVWPNGVDRLSDIDDRTVKFKQAYADWLRAYDARTPGTRNEYADTTQAWIDTVLDQLADWENLHVDAADLPTEIEVRSPGEQIRIRPDGALEGRDTDFAALLRTVESSDDLRGPGLDGWSATEIDRMAALLRKANIEIGIVTDGRWWAIVWAHRDKPTGSAVTDAATWGEEPLVRDAFLALINQRRFRAKDADERLLKLLERSELEAEEITEALGTQVRKAVELLVGSFSRHRLESLAAGDPDPLSEKDDDVYQAAVTVMMRVVFILFAEERGMLPTGQLYWDSYAIRDVLDDLQKRAARGEELLDETYDAWHRLLAVSDALHAGVNFDEMRMPAYGGSLLDPGRFPWLSATDHAGLRIKVPDRVMLHVLKSVQYAYIGKEPRRISFRDIDVEQIGYIYEGLLGYTCTTVEDEVVIGLDGKGGEEPEIDTATLQELYNDSVDGKDFAKALRDWVTNDQPSAKPTTVPRIAKAYDLELTDDQRAEATRQLNPIAGDDKELLELLVAWSALIRRDLRGIPFVVPVGGLVVTETPSRKRAGAHYTPRSLAEEVVQHALEPLVYEPGPLQENDRGRWQLKGSTAILDLKVADIAVGSGAFLVAAARFLAERLVEAWTAEDAISVEEKAQSDRAYERAIREVVARCLYGADINPMAVEMCKLSLWLVSLDPTKPFSFVDDKIFCGNSLLGATNVEQLRHLHINPDPAKDDLITELVKVDVKLAEATRLRRELASPVAEHDPMRSRAGKDRLLGQARYVTAELRDIADGIIAAGLSHGGKPGARLDDAYKALSWALSEAYPQEGLESDRARLDEILANGLTPAVETDYDRWQPIHWVIEAPDVMLDHGGFDAVVGNPPFLVAKDISAAVGQNVREWLTNVVAQGRRGKADMAASFLLRATGVLARDGQIGLLLPKSISEGATRKVGLDSIVKLFTIHRSKRSMRWPTRLVTVWVSVVWVSAAAVLANRWCDGEWVKRIGPSLEPIGEVEGSPHALGTPPPAFKGSVLQGSGFKISTVAASALVRSDRRNRDVVKPYLNGSSVNAGPIAGADGWVIDFRELSEEAARSYREPWAIVAEHVMPERLAEDAEKYPRMVQQWWKHWNTRVEMYERIRQRDSVWALSAVSKHAAPVLVPTDAVLSSALVVFDSDESWLFGILASSVHKAWVARWGSTMQTDIRYAPSDLWVTFPLPEGVSKLNNVAKDLYAARQALMLGRDIGVTDAISLVDEEACMEDDVEAYRDALRKFDLALCEKYGWDVGEIEHDFGFYRNTQRYWLSRSSRLMVLDRLLELNHERARAEGQEAPEQSELF